MKWWTTTLGFLLDHNGDLSRAPRLLIGLLGECEGPQTWERVRSDPGGPRLVCHRARGLAAHRLSILGTNQRAQRCLMVLGFHRDGGGCECGQRCLDVQMASRVAENRRKIVRCMCTGDESHYHRHRSMMRCKVTLQHMVPLTHTSHPSQFSIPQLFFPTKTTHLLC